MRIQLDPLSIEPRVPLDNPPLLLAQRSVLVGQTNPVDIGRNLIGNEDASVAGQCEADVDV
ncbi:MAG: hypothetical protein ACRES7_08130 [Gammaproteobacteria bacterium]